MLLIKIKYYTLDHFKQFSVVMIMAPKEKKKYRHTDYFTLCKVTLPGNQIDIPKLRNRPALNQPLAAQLTREEVSLETLLRDGVIRLELDPHVVVQRGDNLGLLCSTELPVEL